MTDRERILDPSGVKAYYDRFGAKQDSQGFYEDPALEDLIGHAAFEKARHVFEFGCGTGKLAARLLEHHLPGDARYRGCDLSPVMVGLARTRLERFGPRAQVTPSDPGVAFPLADRAVDRVIACYVLDLLPEADIWRFFDEAHRVLAPGGRVCLASLTRGTTPLSRFVSSAWAGVFRLKPALVGGCRPIVLDPYIDARKWRVVHKNVVTPYGLPSEVMVVETECADDAR